MARSYARQRTSTQPVPDTRLQGRRLVIARVIWAMLIVLNLVMFALMLPAYFTQLQTVCTAPVCAPVQPAIDTARALQAHSLTIASYAIFTFILMLTIALACCIVGAVIFWRRSNDWMALLVALVLTMVGNVYVTYSLQQSHSAWQWPAFYLNTIMFTIIFLFFGLFPDGRFVPRWARWITVAWIGWGIVFPFFSHLSFSIMLDNLVWLCLYGCSVVAQILRYLSMSDSVHRQQIKWIVFGMCLTMIAVVGLRVPAIVFPSLGPGSLYDLASGPGLMLAMIPFPLSIGFAVMRARLWDIDNIINRTLVYTILTVKLALAYFGGVALLQYLFRAFTGQGSLFAVVGSTLAIAALFHPLRRYLQTTIDTCFYRYKYDASQVLASFDDTVRSYLYSCNEQNREMLAGDVQALVEKTLQPSHISLWVYALELPKEARVTSALVWEDQEEAPQELYLRISKKSLAEERNSEHRYQQDRSLKQGLIAAWSTKLHNRPGNIDVLINRVLIYGALISVLALVSTGALLIQQQLAQVLPAAISELFIVGSILAMVMCFKPLRQHMQSFIDRHFYQHKYRAEQRLDGFTTTLRHEVDLTRLSEGLIEVVSEAMESECVSLWINKPEPVSEMPRYTGVLQQ